MRLSGVRAILFSILTAFAVGWLAPSFAGARSAAEASEIARNQTGGRVLAVKSTDRGFQVKVLTPDGKVRHVFVPRD
jgi:hypothetical protein